MSNVASPPAAPNIDTHVPLKIELPQETNDLLVGRPDLPTPSLWQQSVVCKHKVTGRVAIVARVDWGTNMFRAYYPDEGEIDPDTGKPAGRYSERTDWQQCAEWQVEVTFSPRELERQQAREMWQLEIATLDPKSLAAVSVLCDDTDPMKALAKLEALRAMGVIKSSVEVTKAAVDEMKKGK